MAKIQPAHRVLRYEVPDNTVVFVDLAKALSMINRRLYRQGMNYYVERIEVIEPAANILVQALPDTWMTQNAWKKAFHLWRSQIQYIKDQGLPSIEGKWADFKILPDDLGHNEITPVDGDGIAILTGEWNTSNYFWDDDGTERSPTFHMVGSTSATSSIGMIEEYCISRANPGTDPIVDADASDSIYAKGLINDEIQQDLVDAIESENDNPPYDADDYYGGHANADVLPVVAAGTTTAEYPVATLPGFIAPCGLLKLYNDNAAGGTGTFLIHMAPGTYKGVMAEPMGQ